MTTLKHALAIMILMPGLAGAVQADDQNSRFQRHGRDHFAPQRETRHAVEYRNDFRHREHRRHDYREHRRHGHHEARPDVVRIVVNPWVVNTRYVAPLRVVRQPPAPPPAVWYFCANPVGYYPNVDRCYATWQAVPTNAWSDYR